jgi:hypothetical protein
MIDYFTSLLLEQPIDKEFTRIQNKKELSSIKIPYTTQYLDFLISHFEYTEEYEKCQILLNYKSKKITHDGNI